MGRDSKSYCEDCKVAQWNGYGSSTTWLDSEETVADFDRDVAKDPRLGELNKNKNVRAFLVAHAGHKIGFTSSDWDSYDPEDETYKRVQTFAVVKAPFET